MTTESVVVMAVFASMTGTSVSLTPAEVPSFIASELIFVVESGTVCQQSHTWMAPNDVILNLD